MGSEGPSGRAGAKGSRRQIRLQPYPTVDGGQGCPDHDSNPHGMHAGAKSPWEASRAALHSHTDKTCGRRRGDWPLQILDMLPRSYVNLRHAMARPRTARVTPPLRAKGTYLGSQTTPAAFNGQSLSPAPAAAAAREAQGRGSLAARAGREEEMTAGARGRTRWATGAPRVER